MMHDVPVKIIEEFDSKKIIKKRISFLEKNLFNPADEIAITDHKLSTRDLVQKFTWINSGNSANRIIDDLIKHACVRVEKATPNSGELSLSMTIDIAKKLAKNTVPGKIYSFNDIYSARKTMQEDANVEHHVFRSDMLESFLEGFDDKKISIIARESILLAGRGAIHVEKGNQEDTRITRSNGAKFKISCPNFFLPTSKKWEKRNVKVVLIDGIVENISEINHLLEEAASSDNTYMIVARGYEPDVIQTLYVNILRGTIDVMPVLTDMDQNTVNIFTDLGIICGCDVISSLKGELISKVQLDNLAEIDRVTVTGGQLEIQNKKTSQSIYFHIKNLKKKRDNTLSEFKTDYFQKRINALSQNSVSISIGQKHLRDDYLIVEKLDKAFRSFSSILKFGYIERKSLIDIFEKYALDNSKVYIERSSFNIFPYMSAIFSISSSFSCVKDIFSTGCIIVRDS